MSKSEEIQPTAIVLPPAESGSAEGGAPGTWAVSGHAWSERPPAEDQKDPLIGTTLNEDYVVESLLGEGGMGRVYEARHTRIAQKRYAIKVLRAEMAHNSEVLQRFQREAEAAACISHPNVVGVYDVARTPDGLPYLACEHLQGIELADYLDQVGALDQTTAVHVCVQICEALEAAHARGVIHRDLKPQNIFLVGPFTDGVPSHPFVKVLDFGLSRIQDVEGNTLTRTGVIMGTPSFMAPEQARGDRTDHRTDIYGVGAILYNLLTGELPFAEETPAMTILAVMGRDPPRPRSLEPSVPEHLELVIQRAMAKDPTDRYPDIASLRLALEPFAMAARPAPSHARGSKASLDAEGEAVSSARPKLILLLLVAALLLAVVLAMAVVASGVLTGWFTFNATELTLILLAAAGTAATPAFILVRKMRRDVWNNTARVLTALHNLRASLTAGILVYGSASLLIRFGDVVLARFTKVPLVGPASGVAWAGWDLLFPLVAALAAGAVILRRQLQERADSAWKRLIAVPGFTAAMLVVSSGILYGGLLWRAATSADDPAAQSAQPDEKRQLARDRSTEAVPTRGSVGAGALGSAATGPSSQPKAASPGPSRASTRPGDDELAAAIKEGEKALLPLAEKYPEAPEVLRPLVIAYASRATGLADSMVVAGRLFAVASEQSRDTTMRVLVSKAAQTPGRTSDLAFGLMTKEMGSDGLDLLYELMLTRTKLSAKIQEILSREDLQAGMSPALKIAYDLRRETTCAGKVPLLERAAALGDERSATILRPLATKTKWGCGKRKRLPCPPPCAKEATAFLKTLTQIQARLSGAP